MKLLVHTNPTFFRHDWIWHHQIIPYLQWLPYSDCPKVHKTTWYMLHYGGTSPKPLFGFCNSKHVGKLNQGRLQGWATKKKTSRRKEYTKTLSSSTWILMDKNGGKEARIYVALSQGLTCYMQIHSTHHAWWVGNQCSRLWCNYQLHGSSAV